MTGRALVEFERDERGTVAHLFYDRTAKLNSLDRDGIERCIEAVATLGDRDNLRCLVITGAGEKAFVGGADLDTLAELDEENGRIFISRLHDLMRAVRDLPVPTIARVNGWCLGAGMELAAACDMRIAVTTATFGMPEVRVGVPSVIEAALLPRLIGWGRAARLVLTGETIDAHTAERWGFVEELASTTDLDAAVSRVVDAILSAGPNAVLQQKRLLAVWETGSVDAAVSRSIAMFGETCGTGEPKRMIDAFREQRRKG